MVNRTDFESRPGTYALLLFSSRDVVITVGRLGELKLHSGFYVYVGSAHGTGGVRARLGHHIRLAGRPHWHIDYLRRCTTLEEIWFCYDGKSREHRWARRFAAMPGVSMPMIGFGSSDCDCETHLFFFKRRPAKDGFDGHAVVNSTRASLPTSKSIRHPRLRQES